MKKLFVLFGLLFVFAGFRWRRPKWLSLGRDPHGKRAMAAQIRKEIKERKALQKEEAKKITESKLTSI